MPFSHDSAELHSRRQNKPARPLEQFDVSIPVEFFRTLSESMTDMIAVLDKNGRRLYNSPSYAKILGDTKKLVGTNSFAEIHPQDRGRVQAIFRKTFKTGIGQRAEFRFLLPDGTIRHIESQGSVIRDQSGEPCYLVVVSRDITERKKIELQMVEITARGQRRIGQDFYERLGQDLTGVGFMGKLLQEALAEKALPEAAQAAEIVKFVTQAVNQTRHLSRGLLSLDLQVKGLTGALKELCANVSNLFSVSCVFRDSAQVLATEPTMILHLYRIAEEALHDAIRNRRATRLMVVLSSQKNEGMLSITDNALDATSNETRLGLKLVKYLASFIGGEITTNLLPQGGRVLTCVFPQVKASSAPFNMEDSE